jgi:hypothetical protein
MSKITVNPKKVLAIIAQLEDASESFCNFGCVLEPAMLDEDLRVFDEIGGLLGESIFSLQKLVDHQIEASSLNHNS